MPRWLPPIPIPEAFWRITVLGGRREPIEVARHTFILRDLHPAFGSLRAVFISDVHCGPLVPDNYLRAVFDHAASLSPDLFLLGGDYIDRRSDEFPRLLDLAAVILRAGRPVVGVLGNHDWWPEPARNGHPRRQHSAQNQFLTTGIRLVDHSRVYLRADRTLADHPDATSRLCIAGLGDALEDSADPALALGGIPSHIPRIVLAHNPDSAALPAIHNREHRIDLMLCGHTHGGQCVLPLIGPPMLLIRNRRYGRGLCQGPGFPILTSRGVGVTSLPIRLNCPPQIHELTFLPETPGNPAIRP